MIDRLRAWMVGLTMVAAAVAFTAAWTPVQGSSEQVEQGLNKVSAERIIEHIKYLSSDELEGRGTGESGGKKAAEYIAESFAGAGLVPAGDDGSYLQEFDVTVEASLGELNELAILYGDIREAYQIKTDFLPLSFSESATASGEVVFAGYGISSEGHGYDDYDGIDVDGKIVLVMRHEPAAEDEESPFDGTSPTHYCELRYKAMNAREHGAAAMVLCTGPLNRSGSKETLFEFDAKRGRSSVGIPCVQLSGVHAEELVRSAGHDLGELQTRIDRDIRPNSKPLPGVRLKVTTEIVRESRRAYNVLGLLRGSDPVLSGECVVLGAHYDHLGMKGEDIYHGADDNASGTAALLELAGVMASLKRPPARSVLFAAFTGEELGLLGSTHLVSTLQSEGNRGSHERGDGRRDAGTEGGSGDESLSNEEPAGDRASKPSAAMLNMDMIGRLQDEKVLVGGVESSPLFEPLLDRLANEHGLVLDYSEPAYGASDHTAFYAKDVPVLMFFTGAHTDHHKPSDTWDKINAEGEARVASLVAEALLSIASHPKPITFTEAAGQVASPHRGEGYGGRGRASLGIVPDFSGGAEGVKLAGVREGTAAEEAGLKGGDVMVSFDGRSVKDLADLSYLLKEKQPGDAVVIIVLRDGEELTLKATLRSR
jgi:hypothetical protein